MLIEFVKNNEEKFALYGIHTGDKYIANKKITFLKNGRRCGKCLT